MSLSFTAAGESLIARLQAEGRPLVIDTFIFAHVPGQDHTAPVDIGAGVPEGNVVYETAIPPEYRAFVTPNQVVYSALLDSNVGPFKLNWQGLYCSEHATLVAVATFPAIEKRKYNPETNTAGNNLTRNFLLTFSGAQALTGIVIEASTWQLDFTVRLAGIDERERLSNLDVYGHEAFFDEGWLLAPPVESPEPGMEGAYYFTPGVAYVGGVRAALAAALPAYPAILPCKVWLDVSLQRQGSDVVAMVATQFIDEASLLADYTESGVCAFRHYVAPIAHIDAEGNITDLRQGKPSALPEEAEEGDILQYSLGGWDAAPLPKIETDNQTIFKKNEVLTVPGCFWPGDIELKPFRPAELPAGWYFCNGDFYELASPQGQALNALSAQYKTDWGIAISGQYISIPSLFHSDGRGLFLRASNAPGGVVNDQFRSHTHTVSDAKIVSGNLSGWFTAGSGGQVIGAGRPAIASVGGTETAPLNVGMTPAIYLGV